ncbi:ABC transporter permease [Acuticoccus sediminis]|uniref:ABC transporter permease n=1 Tax=Acuticoccus sediminis TaxID=2184697 RepID=A0A8B2NW36_9HYPH|nr:ABC transporter permease [Acuticoccus sediminis]RAI02528.1 ABC transporter permease [Acuticoccus sediminis]
MTAAFLVTKVLRCIATLFLALTFVFVVLRLSGDPVERMLPDDTPPEVQQRYREMWGLDRTLPEQFAGYVRSVFTGDLGFSFRDGREATEVVLERVPATLVLAGLALTVMLLIGIPSGIMAALNKDSWLDRVTMGATVLGYSVPNFFLGILLIMLFSMTLRWLPSSGSGSWKHLVMPAVTYGTAYAGMVARYTRSSMLEVLDQPFMRTAWAKGVGWRARVIGHALPNASIPLITVLGLRIGMMIGGATVIETVFGYPGVGSLLVNAVAQRDLAVVQVIVLLIAVTMVVVNLAVDLLYTLLDPRVSTTEARGAAR